MNEARGGLWRWYRGAAVLVATVGLVLVAAACSSTSSSGPSASSSSSAGGAGSTQAAAGSAQSQKLAFAQCMRAHGLPDFPDPNPSGGFNANSSAQRSNPNYQSAYNACHHLLPYGGTPPNSQNKVSQDMSQLLQFAQCMRSHGVPNYPDPGSNTGGTSGGNSNISQLQAAGIDVHSAQFQKASQECEQLNPLPSGGPKS